LNPQKGSFVENNFKLSVKLSASQFLSRRSVPKEQSKIARHFNAGKGLGKSSPAGTAGEKRRFQPSLRHWMAIPSDPGVQTPGYVQNVPAGRSFFGCPKIKMRPVKLDAARFCMVAIRFAQGCGRD
jgi:hypothetical protein